MASRRERIAPANVVPDFAVMLHQIVAELFQQNFRMFLCGLQYFCAAMRLGGVDIDQRPIRLRNLGQIDFIERIVNDVKDIQLGVTGFGHLDRQRQRF